MPFDGKTYNRKLDKKRLLGQLARVQNAVSNRKWWTLRALSAKVNAPEASVSARLRDLRKIKFGGYRILARRVDGRGTFEYRMS